jgi:hypothetical protein
MIELPDYRYLSETEKHAISTKCKMLHLTVKKAGSYDHHGGPCGKCKFNDDSGDYSWCTLQEYHSELTDMRSKDKYPFEDEWTGNEFITDGKKIFRMEICQCGSGGYPYTDVTWMDWLFEEVK